MLKIKSSALWIAFILLLVCAGIFYIFSFLHHELIPNGSRFPWALVTSDDGNGSTIAVEQGGIILAKIKLTSEKNYPFANINFIFGGEAKTLVDWSRYSTLNLRVRCEPANVLLFSVGTFDERVTHEDDPGSYRPSVSAFTCTKNWTTVAVDLTRLNTPDWWLERYKLQVSDKQYALNSVSSFSILHSAQTPVETEYSYEIAAVTLEGRNAYIQAATWLFALLALLPLLLLLYNARLNKNIPPVIASTKPDAPVFIYEPLPVENRKDKLKTSLLQFLATEYSNPYLTLESTITTLGINRIKINEILKEQYGLTFNACLTKLRLTEAARLLERQDKSVAEIGYAVGYKTASYFNRAFKKEYGCTPNAFRNCSPENTG